MEILDNDWRNSPNLVPYIDKEYGKEVDATNIFPLWQKCIFVVVGGLTLFITGLIQKTFDSEETFNDAWVRDQVSDYIAYGVIFILWGIGMYYMIRVIRKWFKIQEYSKKPKVWVQKTIIKHIKESYNKRFGVSYHVESTMEVPNKSSILYSTDLVNVKDGDVVHIFYNEWNDNIIKIYNQQQWNAAVRRGAIEEVE